MNSLVVMLRTRLFAAGEIEVVAQGGCMAPLLLHGDLVTVRPATRFVVGRLYLAVSDGEVLVLHRLVAIHRDYAVLKGDRAKSCETVPFNAVVGEAVSARLADVGFSVSLRCPFLLSRISALASRGVCFGRATYKFANLGSMVRRVCRRVLRVLGACLRVWWKVRADWTLRVSRLS